MEGTHIIDLSCWSATSQPDRLRFATPSAKRCPWPLFSTPALQAYNVTRPLCGSMPWNAIASTVKVLRSYAASAEKGMIAGTDGMFEGFQVVLFRFNPHFLIRLFSAWQIVRSQLGSFQWGFNTIYFSTSLVPGFAVASLIVPDLQSLWTDGLLYRSQTKDTKTLALGNTTHSQRAPNLYGEWCWMDIWASKRARRLRKCIFC